MTMIPATALAYLKALEAAVTKFSTPYTNRRTTNGAKGTPLGKNYEVIADAMGKMLVKPKRKPVGRTLNQEYASKYRKKWKGVAR